MGNPDERTESELIADDTADISFKGEILRKTTHIGALCIPAIYYFTDTGIIIPLLIAAFALSFSVEMIRFYGGEKNKRLIQRLFGIMIRPHEKKGFTGATYILASSIISILIFDKTIAILAIAYIVVGDTAGAIVGRLWGRVKFRNKTLEGSASFFLSCCIVSLSVPDVELSVKLIGAFAAATVEALTVYVDDNLTVPLISGAIMQLLVR